jgi:hypothetical protein
MKQLLTFFGLAYFISWVIWLPLYGHVFGLNLPTLPFHHGIGGLGPLIAAFLTTWIFLKKAGLKDLVAKCLQIKPLVYLAIALFSPFVLAFLALLISYGLDKTPIDVSHC